MRLFAGIELDAAVRETCVRVQDALRSARFEARYESPEKLHITLAFLGNVNTTQTNDVEDALTSVASRSKSFDLELNRVGAFPHERRPRIVYVGSYDAGPGFRALAGALRAAYRELGFSLDEDAVAHVTIARVKGGSKRPLPLVEPAATFQRVERIVLFESLPHEGSTRYDVRARAALQQTRAGPSASG